MTSSVEESDDSLGDRGADARKRAELSVEDVSVIVKIKKLKGQLIAANKHTH